MQVEIPLTLTLWISETQFSWKEAGEFAAERHLEAAVRVLGGSPARLGRAFWAAGSGDSSVHSAPSGGDSRSRRSLDGAGEACP